MSTSRTIGNSLALCLAAFQAFCLQAHITDKLTPTFARMVEESLGPLNDELFWFLGVTPATLNHIMPFFNVLLLGTLVPRRTRKTGLALSLVLFSVGLYGDIATGVSVAPHVVMIAAAGTARFLLA
jgi:hypothetical protein